jgi:hypothetical protein
VWICLLCVCLFLFKSNSKIAKLEEELRLVNNALKTLEHNEEKVKFVLKKNFSLLYPKKLKAINYCHFENKITT